MQLCQMGGPVLGRMSSVWEHGLAIAVGVERFWCNRVEVFCNALEEVGWPQPKTPIQMDNSTATGFINNIIIQRQIKTIWMCLHWLCCREARGQFRFYWDKGSKNMADYHTKYHPLAYHLAHRPTHVGWQTGHLQGCVAR